MGFFEKRKEKRKMEVLTQQFKLINGYNASFSTYQGGIYEMGLTRSAIETIATHCSKAVPKIIGDKYKRLNAILQTKPNYLMTTQQFLSKLITLLICDNNAFILPIYSDNSATKIIGLYPLSANGTEIVTIDGKNYLRYQLDGKRQAIEYERVGHLRKHFNSKDFYGDSNNALNSTMELLNTQNEGIVEGIKQSACIRFLARLSNVLLPEDMKKERNRLVKDNLGSDNNGGVMIFDNKYADVKAIDSKPWVIDDKQSTLIKESVLDYFHVSEEVLQNKASEDQWNAFYEGCIEPILIQLSQVLTTMLFTIDEISNGLCVVFESIKLQFASNNTKLQVSQQLFDRGIMTTNQIMDVWNLSHVKDGEKRYIRKEYTEVSKLDIEEKNEEKEEEIENDNKGQKL